MPKILVFAGSTRKDSYNKRLARIAFAMLKESGVDATLIDLADLPMPLYDGDLEEEAGKPENAVKLKRLFIEHDGFLIASPEYNKGFSAVLKNAIDWVSRTDKEDPHDLYGIAGKTGCLVSASISIYGGIRGLHLLRAVLSQVGMFLTPTQYCLSSAQVAFNEDGSLKDAKQIAALSKTVDEMVMLTKAISKKQSTSRVMTL